MQMNIPATFGPICFSGSLEDWNVYKRTITTTETGQLVPFPTRTPFLPTRTLFLPTRTVVPYQLVLYVLWPTRTFPMFYDQLVP
jgi:hypothetical protein